MIWRWLVGLVLAPLAAAALYIVYAGWAYRDIPVTELERRYGDADLRSAEIDGVPIRYRLQGRGPALVLIHSHYLDMGMWQGWLPLLIPHFTVLRYDLAGHGLTGPDPAGVYSVERDVALLAGLLDRLGIERAALVGSSLGGNIAFTFAARHPQRVSALVLVNSGGLKRSGSRSGAGIPAWADQVLPLVPPLALHAFLTWMAADDAAIDAAMKRRFVDLWRRAGNRPAELARLRNFATGEPEALLAAVAAPTLIQWGEANPQLPVALAEQFERKLTHAPRVERKIYSGAGHILPVERPAASGADAVAFLRATAGSEEAAP